MRYVILICDGTSGEELDVRRVYILEARAHMGYEAVNIGLEFIKGTDHRGVCMIKQNKLGFKQTFVNPLSANFTK